MSSKNLIYHCIHPNLRNKKEMLNLLIFKKVKYVHGLNSHDTSILFCTGLSLLIIYLVLSQYLYFLELPFRLQCQLLIRLSLV
jgi:hypothetical protein